MAEEIPNLDTAFTNFKQQIEQIIQQHTQEQNAQDKQEVEAKLQEKGRQVNQLSEQVKTQTQKIQKLETELQNKQEELEQVKAQAQETPPQEPESTTPKIEELSEDGVKERQRRKQENLDQILQLAEEKGEITNNLVQTSLGLPDSTVREYLRELTQQSKLTRHENGPATSYRLP